MAAGFTLSVYLEYIDCPCSSGVGAGGEPVAPGQRAAGDRL